MLNYQNLISKPIKKTQERETNNLSWLRWLITAIAILGSYATGGLSLKAALAINSAISIAETALHLGLDIHQKQEINPLNLSIEVLATILPIPIAYRTAKRSLKVLKDNALRYDRVLREYLTDVVKNQKKLGSFLYAGFTPKDINWNMKFKLIKQYQKQLNKAFNHPTIRKYLVGIQNAEIDAAILKWGKLSDKDKLLLRSGISSLLKRRRMSEQNMRAVVKSLSYRGKRTLTKNFEKTLVLQKYQSLKTSKRTTAKSYLKYLGSKSFNDKVVQRAQWIDKVDFGRAPIEFGYRKMVKYWNIVLKQGWRQAYKKALKNSQRALKFEKQYRRFKKVDYKKPFYFNSNYLKSMRVLHGWNNFWKDPMVCIMTFVKHNIKSGKNAGGKKPVIFLATKQEYRRLAFEGSIYWWLKSNKFKGWWYTRGGKKPHFLTFAGTNQYVGFLVSALPFQAIKFVSSIISNWVEASFQIAAGEWSWSEYWEGAKKSFKRMGIKRAGRFLGKDLIGRTIAKRFHNPFHKEIIRRVAWGFGTLYTETFIASQKTFKKRDPYTMKELNEIFVDKLQKQFQTKSITLGRSKVRRFSGQALNPYLGKKTARRKWHIVRALRSTFIRGTAKKFTIKLNKKRKYKL